MSIPSERPVASSNYVNRFFGGPTLGGDFCPLVLLIPGGGVPPVVGLDPLNILRSIEDLVRAVWDMGFDAVVRLWRYFLLGAAIVVPVWLIVRLVRTPKGR